MEHIAPADPPPSPGRAGASRRSSRTPNRRGGFAALAMVGLLAVVAAAATRAAPHRVDGKGDGSVLANLVVTVAVVYVSIGMVLVVVAFVTSRGRAAQRRAAGVRRDWVRLLLVLVAVTVLMLFLVRRQGPPSGRTGAAPPPLTRPTALTPTSGPDLTWGPWLGVVIVAIMAVVVLVTALRRRFSRTMAPAPSPEAQPTDTAASVADVLAAVEAEPDPRRAVFAAYDGMQGVLDGVGVKRSSTETPREFLSRAERHLDLSAGAAAGLTASYTLARFSPHTVDNSTRQQAIDALRGIRDELQGSSQPVAS